MSVPAMQRVCEICSKLETPAEPEATKKKLRRVLVGERIVALCDEHATEVRDSGAQSIDSVRALFPETDGRRSLLARRAPLDRRIFPVRPEGRRRSAGRRQDDCE